MFEPTHGNYDEQMTRDMRRTTSAVVGWILMAAYIYYVENSRFSLLSDAQFDKACNWLLRHYDAVSHQYKHLIGRDALSAGTAYHIKKADYPGGIVRMAVLARKQLEAQ